MEYGILKIGQHLSYNQELCSLLSGALFFIITFIIIKKIANRMGQQKKYMPEITKILHKFAGEELT